MRLASITLALLLLAFATPCPAGALNDHGAAAVAGTLARLGRGSDLDVHGQGRACQGCHVKHTERGHPSGFVMQRTLPPRFQLEPGGLFTCRTCHDAQLVDGALPTCAQCHDPAFFDAMADGGMSLRRRAHPASIGSPENAGMSPPATACLECHEDHGERRGAGAGGLMYAASRSAPRNHPLGLPYERATAYGGYVAAALLPPQIKLVDGRLSCLSCHRSYSAQHGATVLPTAGSQLCFACHDL